MTLYKRYICYAVALLLSGTTGCKKYLSEKPDRSVIIISTIEDLQALLDNYQKVSYQDVAAGEVSSDDYFLTDANYNSLNTEHYKRMYVWEKDNLFAQNNNEWRTTYESIYYPNTVLANLDRIYGSDYNAADAGNLKGQALFHRGRSYFQNAQVWCKAYDPITAAADYGLPLRTSVNFNEVVGRSTLQETYQLILSDLKEAAELLPVTAVSVLRPTKTAAYGMLARVFLAIGNFEEADRYASLYLELKSTLIDYNSLRAQDPYPIRRNSVEVIFESGPLSAMITSASMASISPELIALYESNDLRRSIFYLLNASTGLYRFKGSYRGNLTYFSGVSTNELYLIRAECFARAGNTEKSLQFLNDLLGKRYVTNQFTPRTAATPAEALQMVLTERRKELPMRGLRWMDIKRLNKLGANISLNRTVNGVQYQLPANDLRFALPIPDDVILLTGMPQNPR